MPSLEIKTPDGRSRIVELTQSAYILGRDPGCELSFPEDGGLSRQHFSVTKTGEGWSLRDLHSRNGCFVNGERLTAPRVLAAGDLIRASKLQIQYSALPASNVVFEKPDTSPDPQR